MQSLEQIQHMFFDYLVVFIVLTLMKIDSDEILTFSKCHHIFQKILKIDEIFENVKISSESIFINFRAINAIKQSKNIYLFQTFHFSESNMSACTCARAARQNKSLTKQRFLTFLEYRGAEARFPRAQPRARPHTARQSILLIKQMLFDYLIVCVALKLAKISAIEIFRKCIQMRKIVEEKAAPLNGLIVIFFRIFNF